MFALTHVNPRPSFRTLAHGTGEITGLRYADHLRDAEFTVEVIKHQGMGAAAMRIESDGDRN
jgi:hypothetical protein